MDTVTAPRLVKRMPKPTLMIMICTECWPGAMVFMSATTRATAPVSCISVICTMLAAMTKAMGMEATIPAAEAVSTTVGAVPK